MIFKVYDMQNFLFEIESGAIKYGEKNVLLVSCDKSGNEIVDATFPIHTTIIEKSALKASGTGE